MTVAERQQELAPKEDLRPYAGQWVALRDGRVVASDLDAGVLRARPDVEPTDAIMRVPVNPSALYVL